jgi:hypothetical protein
MGFDGEDLAALVADLGVEASRPARPAGPGAAVALRPGSVRGFAPRLTVAA